MVRKYLTLACAFWALNTQAQNARVYGTVYDNATRQPLADANIYVLGQSSGDNSDSTGQYTLSVTSGWHTLAASHIGYRTKKIRVQISGSNVIDFFLDEDDKTLEEVVVSSRPVEHNIKSTDLGVNAVGMDAIKKMPAFLGESDLLKSVLLLPGVTSVGEGTGGVNVRGGNADQNLILMDDAPIFNSSHLMGFLSVFNGDVVDQLNFYKGGIPAQYGGRISSILETKLKVPAATSWKLEGGVGLIANRLLVEGPVTKKISLYVAGRISYPDYLFRMSSNPDVKNTSANFYDLTTKVEYKLNNRNRLTFTGYRSDDHFRLAGDSLSSLEINASSSRFSWSTTNGTLVWNSQLNKKLNLKITGVQGLYHSMMSSRDSLTAYELNAKINYQNLSTELGFSPDERRDFIAGFSGIFYRIDPGTLSPGSGTSTVNYLKIPNQQGIEAAAYLQHDWQMTDKFSFSLGLRYSMFINMGEQTVYSYADDSPRNEDSIIDSVYYKKGEIVNQFTGIEPRITVRINITESSSIKVGYNRMYQYIQQVSNTTAALPTDRWQLSSPYIRPQYADQFSAGYFLNLSNDAIETSAEVYYKDVRNATDYKSGVNLLLSAAPESAMLQGKGRAYGMELMAKKNKGKLTGWVSYTFSQTHLKINGNFPEESINHGNWYAANYNKPHTLNLVASYQTRPRTSFSANFTYSTGRPVTYPQDKYLVQGVFIPNYTGRNDERIPDYHRLDVSLTIKENPAQKSRWKSSWVFSIYNLYGRKNAYSIFFKPRSNAIYNKKADAYKLSVFGTIFPSITYNFKF